MIKLKFIPMIAFAVSAAFLLGSTSAFAQIEDDYHQKQNKVIDPNERDTKPLNLDQSGSSSQQQSGSSQQQGGSSQQQGGGMSGGQSSGGQGMDHGQSSDSDKKKGY